MEKWLQLHLPNEGFIIGKYAVWRAGKGNQGFEEAISQERQCMQWEKHGLQ